MISEASLAKKMQDAVKALNSPFSEEDYFKAIAAAIISELKNAVIVGGTPANGMLTDGKIT